MKVIGITGGVGCGKSRLLESLQTLCSCRVMLADEAAARLEEPGQKVYEDLVELMETSPQVNAPLLMPDGTINRAEMAARMFPHPELREKVNSIVHPAVMEYIVADIDQARMQDYDYYFVEAALLIESGYRCVVDEIWYIWCDEPQRRRRLKENRHYSDEKIQAIMDSQLSEAEFRAACDRIIDNSGTPEQAIAQIKQALESR